MWIIILVSIVGGLALLIALLFVAGLFIAREHTATRAAAFNKPAAEVWSAITNVADATTWRTGLRSVTVLDPLDGKRRWVEDSRHGKMAMIVVSEQPLEKLVTRIDDDALPFGGTWTFTIEHTSPTACRLRITEDGFIRPPPFRVMAKYIFGYTATMEQYLKDLGRKFGQDVRIEP